MEVKRSEVQRLDAEHEVTRLKAALDRQTAESKQLQVRCVNLCVILHYITRSSVDPMVVDVYAYK